jgi:hypothetical protein
VVNVQAKVRIWNNRFWSLQVCCKSEPEQRADKN